MYSFHTATVSLLAENFCGKEYIPICNQSSVCFYSQMKFEPVRCAKLFVVTTHFISSLLCIKVLPRIWNTFVLRLNFVLFTQSLILAVKLINFFKKINEWNAQFSVHGKNKWNVHFKLFELIKN
jgi:hypothetical protein